MANTALVCAASSAQCWLRPQSRQPPSLRHPWCRQPLERRLSSAERGPWQVEQPMMRWQRLCAQPLREPEAELHRRHRLRRQQLQPRRRLQRLWLPPPSQWRQPQLPSAWQPLESHRSRPCPRKAVGRRQEIPWTCTSKGWVLAQGQPRLQHASGSHGREVASTWRDFQCSRPWISSPRRRCRFAASRMVLRAGGGDPPGGSADDLCGGLQPGAQ